MKINTFLTGLFMLLSSMSAVSQESVDYQHKVLRKSMHKEGIGEISTLKEFEVSSEIFDGTIHNGRYFYIDDTISLFYDYLYVGRVYSCRSGGCAISYEERQHGNTEYFDYYILFDSTFSVKKVKVFNYQATHGHEITAKGWLKQFEGYKGEEILMPGKTVDAISGATISVYALCHDLEFRFEQLIKASGLEL